MKTITSALILTLIVASCGTSPKSDSDNHEYSSEVIELNNGEKWKVDKNMMVHISNMDKAIQEFNSTEQKDYKLLAKSLQNNIDKLTSKCTMKGKAHDELHKWLLPYIKMVKKLSSINGATESTNQFKEIEETFKTFNQYFE